MLIINHRKTGVLIPSTVRKRVRKHVLEEEMRRFYLFKRGQVYYVQFVNPLNGKKLTAKSTGATDKEEANYIAMDWFKFGIPEKTTQKKITADYFSIEDLFYKLRHTPLNDKDVSHIVEILKKRNLIADVKRKLDSKKLIQFLNEFWDYENSLYVQDKLSHGHQIGQRRCKEALSNIRIHWEPYFLDKALEDVTRIDMHDFSLHLSQKSKLNKKGKQIGGKLSAASLNRIIGYGTVATSWALKQGILKDDPCSGLMRFSGKKKKRGILSDKEVNKLFSEGNWSNNEGARLGNLLASQTGMRAGEIMALRICDILDDRIHVSHSYSREEGGLKSTKTGEEREIPILSETRELLLKHAKSYPYEITPDNFIFYSLDKPGIPMGTETFLTRLKAALRSIGIDNTQQTARNITFHGWRHYYARKMVDVLDQRTAKLTGHASQEMLDHYSNHANEEDFKKAAEATAEVFGKVIPFKQEAVQ